MIEMMAQFPPQPQTRLTAAGPVKAVCPAIICFSGGKVADGRAVHKPREPAKIKEKPGNQICPASRNPLIPQDAQ